MNLKTKRKLYQYFKQKLGATKPNNKGWMKATCPCPEQFSKFGINLGFWRTNCFKCTHNPKPIEVVMELENLQTQMEAFKFIDTFEEADYIETQLELLDKPRTMLPESFKLLRFADDTMGRLAVEYLEGRGLDVRKLSRLGVGYCSRGRYVGKIIMPFYEKGNLVYFQSRKFLGIGIKFDNPTIDDVGIGKSLLIYNVDALAIYNTIAVVESVINCWTLGDQTIGISGKVMSKYQLQKLIKSPVKNFIIFFDPDAYWWAIGLGLTLCQFKKVKVIDNRHWIDKDINDKGVEESNKLIRATPWQEYKDLYKIRLSLEKPEGA
jgi:hypothetical protein